MLSPPAPSEADREVIQNAPSLTLGFPKGCGPRQTDRCKWELGSPGQVACLPPPPPPPAFWRKFKRFFCSPGLSRSVASIIPQLRKHPPPYVDGRAWVSRQRVVEDGILKVGRGFPSQHLLASSPQSERGSRGRKRRLGQKKRGGCISFNYSTPTNLCSHVLFLCLFPKQRNSQPSSTHSGRLAREPNCWQIELPKGHL